MTNLIIGGAGFIGTNLADRLARSGEAVTVADNFFRVGTRSNASWLADRHPTVSIAEIDIRTALAELEEAVQRATRIFHLAGQVAVTSSIVDPRADFEMNALGTLNVLESMRRVESTAVLVYSSTNKVYGRLESVPVAERDRRYELIDRDGISEDQPLDFHSPYACSKGAADQYVRDYARIYGLRTVVLRQSCIYGPRQFGVEDQGWLAWFTIATLLDQPITIYGSGKQVRDVLHVDDLIDLMLAVCQQGDRAAGSVYNVGGGAELTLSLLETIELLEQSTGVEIDPAFADERPGDQPIYISDISRVHRDLGWQPRVQPAAGLEQLVGWVDTNRELVEHVLAERQAADPSLVTRR
jgi:CDP-paratose 2-epimerase